MRIIYNSDGTKTVTSRKASRFQDLDSLPFPDRIMRSYYDLECQHKLRPGENYNKIKRTWELDKARAEAGIGQ